MILVVPRFRVFSALFVFHVIIYRNQHLCVATCDSQKLSFTGRQHHVIIFIHNIPVVKGGRGVNNTKWGIGNQKEHTNERYTMWTAKFSGQMVVG